MDLQLRDLEYKIGAGDRKNQDSFNELQDQAVRLQAKLAEESQGGDENDSHL